MSESCCPNPAGPVSAGTAGAEQEACCALHPPVQVGPMTCPECNAPGKSVQRVTLGALLKPEPRARIPKQEAFFFCRTTDCQAVYFQPGTVLFREDDLTVRVHQKESGNPAVPVCYCFGWTPQRIGEEIERTGKSTAVQHITAQVHAGNCYCEVTNPQGSCCLGNVGAAVKRITASSRT
jgi:hypothetical protein